MKVLLVVDMQNDFMPGGALPVPNGHKVTEWVKNHMRFYEYLVFTQDYHPIDHCSFKENGGLWPAHCITKTHGSKFTFDVEGVVGTYWLTIKKGMDSNFDSYSGFKDDGGQSTGLSKWLKQVSITELDVVGVATEYCVKFTVIDALEEGFKVNVLKRGCRGLTPKGCKLAFKEMENKGATVR
jgi:nicotinamidase/pyrazinamidase